MKIIKGNVDLSFNNLKELPDLSDVKVLGHFDCGDNELTSLKGSPAEVGRDFFCTNSKLSSLIDAPRKVGGDFFLQ